MLFASPVSLLVDPGMGAIWYCPARLLALHEIVVLCGRRPPCSFEGQLAMMAGLLFLGIGVYAGPFLQRASQHWAAALGNAQQFARRNS